MKKINLDEPIDRIIQEEIKETLNSFYIIKWEDTGTEINCATNLGLISLYNLDDYPRGGIFNLNESDLIDLVKSKITGL
jgi:hypothetical protein